MRIAIVGAESTGKSSLAAELAAHFRTRGHAVHAVDEVLREWCVARQRTPLAHEQMGIAQEQARRADAAPAGSVVVADTTPLMIAVYSDMLFNDPTLYPFALSHQRSYDLTLLTALDLPWVADGLQRDGPHVREPVDALVRKALQQAGLAFGEVSGVGTQRLASALAAVTKWQRDRPL